MIKFYKKTVTDRRLKTLKKFNLGSWVYIEDPTEDEIKKIKNQFLLDEGLLRDAADPLEVPRVEIDNGVIYIFSRFPYSEDGNRRIGTQPILIIIGTDFLLTISARKIPFLVKFIMGKLPFTTTQKTRLFFQIFSEINKSYNLFLAEIGRQIRSFTINLEKISNKDIKKFVILEGVLNNFLSDLVPINAMLQKLLTGKIIKLYEEDKDLVEDLFLSSGQLIELSKANLKSIVNVREAYSTLMTNNLNRVIKLLTAITIILTIPTIITSLYGMNVKLPYDDSSYAFLFIVSGIIVISLFLLLLFHRNRWL